MSVLHRFFLAKIFLYLYFWISIAVPYLLFRGLTVDQALGLIAFYGLLIVLLEYPTGVIGDYYGHKTSMVAGILLYSVAMLLFALPADFAVYTVASVLLALGGSLTSGSDEAFLKSISTNFKQDLANINFLEDFVLMFVAVIGGLLASVNMVVPVVATGVFGFVSAFTLMTIRQDATITDKQTREGNIFALAVAGVKTVQKERILMVLIVTFSFLAAVARLIKTLFGTFGEVFALDVSTIGLLVGLGFFVRAISKKYAPKLDFVSDKVLFMGMITGLMTAALGSIYAAVVGLLLFSSTFGILVLRFKLRIHDLVDDSVRASVLSFNNLILRLIHTLILGSIGLVLAAYSFQVLMFGIGVIVIVVGIAYFFPGNQKSSVLL